MIERAGKRRPVAPGDSVFATDEVVSGDKARVLVSMPDGSLFKLGQNAQLQVKKLNVVTEDMAPKMNSEIKLLRGVLRFATQAVEKVVARRELSLHISRYLTGEPD